MELVSYFILWAIAGAFLGAIFDNESLLGGALKGLAVAIFPIYAILFILLTLILFPLFSLLGYQEKYDELIKKISIF